MPNFDKPTGFTMKMGSKEIHDESSPFSMRDTELMKASPMLKNGGSGTDNDKDERYTKADFKETSDMGKYNPTITSYEGDAFVGTTGGGKRQPKGKKVTGLTQTGNSSNDKFFRGKVTGSGSSRSEQDSKVKGATYGS